MRSHAPTENTTTNATTATHWTDDPNVSRETFKAHWEARKATLIAVVNEIIDASGKGLVADMDNARRVVKAHQHLIRECDDNLHFTTLMQKNTAKMIADRNNEHAALDPNACTKCAGTGTVRGFEHVHGGICFRCEGTGLTR